MAHGLTLRDVCLVVNDLHRTIEGKGIKISAPVQIIKHLIPAVLDKIPPDNKPFSIELERKDWGAKEMHGMLIRRVNGAKILYSTQRTACWRRFIICKELAHILMDDKERHFTKDPVYLVQKLKADIPSPDGDIDSEKFASAAAIEMLLPWILRPHINELCAKGKSDLEIATIYKAPESVVNLLLRTPWGASSWTANNIYPNAVS